MHLENAHPDCVCFDNRKKRETAREKKGACRVYGAMPSCPSVLLKRIQESAIGYCFLL